MQIRPYADCSTRPLITSQRWRFLSCGVWLIAAKPGSWASSCHHEARAFRLCFAVVLFCLWILAPAARVISASFVLFSLWLNAIARGYIRKKWRFKEVSKGQSLYSIVCGFPLAASMLKSILHKKYMHRKAYKMFCTWCSAWISFLELGRWRFRILSFSCVLFCQMA